MGKGLREFATQKWRDLETIFYLRSLIIILLNYYFVNVMYWKGT